MAFADTWLSFQKSKKKKKKEKKEKKDKKKKAKQSEYEEAEGITTPSKEVVPPSQAVTPAAYKLPVRSHTYISVVVAVTFVLQKCIIGFLFLQPMSNYRSLADSDIFKLVGSIFVLAFIL